MKIENVSGVGFSSRGSSKKKGHLSISDGLFGKIVINNQSVFSIVSEVFSDGACRVRGQELKRGSFRGGGGNNDSVSEGIMFFKGFHDVSNSGSLLSNGDVDAVKLFVSVSSFEIFLLVKNGINGNGGFTSLSISNDKFSLSSSNGDQTIDGLKSSLHGFVD